MASILKPALITLMPISSHDNRLIRKAGNAWVRKGLNGIFQSASDCASRQEKDTYVVTVDGNIIATLHEER